MALIRTIPPPSDGGMQLELHLVLPTEEPKSADIIPFVQSFKWSNEDILSLREGLLQQSLKVLASTRTSTDSKREHLKWIMSEDIHPFSFVVCSQEAGYDPSSLRQSTLDVLRRASVGAHWCAPPAE